MITPVTRPAHYFLVWSRDPALELPADDEERRKALSQARETGDWEPLIKPGEKPTLFKCRHLDRDVLWEWDQYRDKNGNDKSATLKGWSLLVRAALEDVHNFGGVKLPKRVKDHETQLMVVPATFLTNFSGDIVDVLVLELGMAILEREHATAPKS